MNQREQPQHTIALVYDYLLHFGGVETHLLSLLRHSDKSSYQWVVIAPTSTDFESQARVLGAQVALWKPAHLLDFVALIRLIGVFRSYGVDLLHIHSQRASVYGRVAGCLLGLPVVVTVHLPAYYMAHGQGLGKRLKRWLYRWGERILNYGLTDQLIYVSSRVCQEALELSIAPRGRTQVINNGIDLAPFADNDQKEIVRRALDTPIEAIVVCYVGRLDEQKGIDILLEALHFLAPKPPALRIWLVGDGPQRAALEAQSRQLGLEADVQFLGFQSNVPDVLKAGDIFVLPSRYEAMPMTILEAMAAGLPCVVTQVGENSEIVEDGITGRVVPSEDPKALASALSELVLNPLLRLNMGQSARRKAQGYDAKHMVARTLTVYDQVMR